MGNRQWDIEIVKAAAHIILLVKTDMHYIHL